MELQSQTPQVNSCWNQARIFSDQTLCDGSLLQPHPRSSTALTLGNSSGFLHVRGAKVGGMHLSSLHSFIDSDPGKRRDGYSDRQVGEWEPGETSHWGQLQAFPWEWATCREQNPTVWL